MSLETDLVARLTAAGSAVSAQGAGATVCWDDRPPDEGGPALVLRLRGAEFDLDTFGRVCLVRSRVQVEAYHAQPAGAQALLAAVLSDLAGSWAGASAVLWVVPLDVSDQGSRSETGRFRRDLLFQVYSRP